MALQRHVTVSHLYDCNEMNEDEVGLLMYNPAYGHNMVGCCLLKSLQQMFNLNITYIIGPPCKKCNTSIDIYGTPQIMSPDILEIANPVQTVILWRFGFILRKSHNLKLYYTYYFKPFTKVVWDCIIAMAIIVTTIFFLAGWFEKSLLGGVVECSLGLEILLMIGGYCQHVFPVETAFWSRRTAHFTFFLYSYIIYTVYTSNLLSHLVNDKEHNLSLIDLVFSDFELTTFPDMIRILTSEYENQNLPSFTEGLARVKEMNINDALEAVRVNQTAFLSDYISVYATIKRKFKDSELCDLIEIDLNNDVRKYIFTSKNFRYIEELKIGTLRLKEAGIIKRLTTYHIYQPLDCDIFQHLDVGISQIFIPLTILTSTFALSIVLLIMERVHYERNRVWPYME